MKVLGVNTNGIEYISIYFQQEIQFVTDPSRSRAYCDELHTWLDEQFGIDMSDYIIRDAYSANTKRYSYVILEMFNLEHLTMLKLAFPSFTRRSYVTNAF